MITLEEVSCTFVCDLNTYYTIPYMLNSKLQVKYMIIHCHNVLYIYKCIRMVAGIAVCKRELIKAKQYSGYISLAQNVCGTIHSGCTFHTECFCDFFMFENYKMAANHTKWHCDIKFNHLQSVQHSHDRSFIHKYKLFSVTIRVQDEIYCVFDLPKWRSTANMAAKQP